MIRLNVPKSLFLKEAVKLILILFTISLFTKPSRAESNLFYPYLTFPTGSVPEVVAIGDVNGDGLNDVVIGAHYKDFDTESCIQVFLQNSIGQLNSPVNYSSGSGITEPVSIDIGDVNNDGRADVIVGNSISSDPTSDYIGIFYQNNSGILEPMVSYSTVNTDSVKIGDFNNDGLLDVVGTHAETVDVLLQNNDGTLDTPVSYSLDFDSYIEQVDVGDINDDSLTDIITIKKLPWTDPSIGVIAQKTDGTLDQPVYYNLATDEIKNSIAVGDINGDDLNDLIVSYGDENIGVILQNDTGTLDEALGYESYHNPRAIEVADMNQDGRQDIIVVHNGWSALGVYLQNPSGTLMPEELYSTNYNDSKNPHKMAVDDINGDGLNDVVLANGSDRFIVLYHRKIEPDVNVSPSLVDFGSADTEDSASQSIMIYNNGTTDLELGQITLSGENISQFSLQNDFCSGQVLPPLYGCSVDVIFSFGTESEQKAGLNIPTSDPDTPISYVSLFGNMQSADLFYPYQLFPTGSWPEAVATGDFNSDGRNDVVVLTSSYYDPDNDYHIHVFLQNASGDLDLPIKYPAGGTYTTATLDVGDVNNDGRTDVVIGNYHPGDMEKSFIGVFYQNDAGTLDPIVTYSTHNSYSIKIGDFNNDNLLDITGISWGLQPGAAGIWPFGDILFQNNSGSLNSPETYYVPHGGYDEVIAGDVSGDGLTDIVAMSGQLGCPDLSVFTQKAGGGMNSPVYLPTYTSASLGVGIGDIDNDTLNDIVVTDRYGDMNIFYQSNGIFGSPKTYNTYDSPVAVKVDDVNYDGREDIITANANLGIYLQDTDGTLKPGELYEIPGDTQNPQGLAISDINGDGLIDALITNYDFGLVVFYHRPLPEADYDATGNWTYSITNSSDAASCFLLDEKTESSNIIQNGNEVTIVDDSDYVWEGYILGTQCNVSTSHSYGEGTITKNLSLTFSSDTFGIGTVAWSWTDGNNVCSGKANITYTKSLEQDDIDDTASDESSSGGGGCFITTLMN